MNGYLFLACMIAILTAGCIAPFKAKNAAIGATITILCGLLLAVLFTYGLPSTGP